MTETAPVLPAVNLRPSVLGSPLLRAHRGLAGKLRWHLNHRLTQTPALLNALGARLTVVDAYGAPGDTLLTAIICRHLRERFSRLRINCLTPNPDLLQHDPNIDALNEPESFFSIWSWYPNLAGRRDAETNILRESFDRLGWGAYEYRARVYLTEAERAAGRRRLGEPRLPVLTFHTKSKEEVKNWPLDSWRSLLPELTKRFHVVHLGDAREPALEGVQRLAGPLSLRDSMSVLAHATVHVGADSFLMHAANGLGVPSVIIFGGSRTPANLGYRDNLNLFSPMACGPCWLHEAKGERCNHGLACLEKITPGNVLAAVEDALRRRGNSCP